MSRFRQTRPHPPLGPRAAPHKQRRPSQIQTQTTRYNTRTDNNAQTHKRNDGGASDGGVACRSSSLARSLRLGGALALASSLSLLPLVSSCASPCCALLCCAVSRSPLPVCVSASRRSITRGQQARHSSSSACFHASSAMMPRYQQQQEHQHQPVHAFQQSPYMLYSQPIRATTIAAAAAGYSAGSWQSEEEHMPMQQQQQAQYQPHYYQPQVYAQQFQQSSQEQPQQVTVAAAAAAEHSGGGGWGVSHLAAASINTPPPRALFPAPLSDLSALNSELDLLVQEMESAYPAVSAPASQASELTQLSLASACVIDSISLWYVRLLLWFEIRSTSFAPITSSTSKRRWRGHRSEARYTARRAPPPPRRRRRLLQRWGRCPLLRCPSGPSRAFWPRRITLPRRSRDCSLLTPPRATQPSSARPTTTTDRAWLGPSGRKEAHRWARSAARAKTTTRRR